MAHRHCPLFIYNANSVHVKQQQEVMKYDPRIRAGGFCLVTVSNRFTHRTTSLICLHQVGAIGKRKNDDDCQYNLEQPIYDAEPCGQIAHYSQTF